MVNNKDKHKDNDKGNSEYKDKDNDEDCLCSCVMVGWSKEERERPVVLADLAWGGAVNECGFALLSSFIRPTPQKNSQAWDPFKILLRFAAVQPAKNHSNKQYLNNKQC